MKVSVTRDKRNDPSSRGEDVRVPEPHRPESNEFPAEEVKVLVMSGSQVPSELLCCQAEPGTFSSPPGDDHIVERDDKGSSPVATVSSVFV